MEFRLTERETEIALLVCQGKTNADIAAILGIRARTVEKHLEHVFPKLRVSNRTATAYVLQRLMQPMHRLRQHA
jgi:DNA-binding CsgD family transcriptional regulator